MNKTTRYTVIGFLLINALFLSGCGSDSGSNQDPQATGEIALSLAWNTASSAKVPISSRASDQAGKIDCEAMGIGMIYVRIYDQGSGDFVKDNGEGWQCSAHSGVIQNVTAGNRKLVCLARDGQGNVIYRGQQLDVTVSASDTASVQVEMDPFVSEPSGLDDGVQITEDTVAFQCNTVENAAQYKLEVATDDNFKENLEKETSDATTFAPHQFTTSNTYYYRICAVDMHGSQGAWSAPHTVDVALPPLVSTNPATNITPTSAVLNGTVIPRGLATTYWFEYRRDSDADDAWIETGKVEIDADKTNADVHTTLQDIDTETPYLFRLVAVNSANDDPIRGDDQTFTTGDGTRPYPVQTQPRDQAINQSVHTIISVNFNEPVQEDTLTAFSFIVSDGSSQIGGAISCTDKVATFTPTDPLNTDTTYYITLKTTIQDLTGNPLQSESTWSFSTIETIPPSVNKTYPLDSARGVQVFPTIKATFNEHLSADTLNSATFLVNDGTENIDGTITYDNVSMTATFLPAANLACNMTYTVTATSGVKDSVGNPMAEDKSWQFKTTDNCSHEIIAGCFNSDAIVLKTDGTLWAWGSNTGILGGGTEEYKNEPTQIGTDTDWAVVTARVALKTDGTLWAWGAALTGELRDETNEDKTPPIQIGTDTDWSAIASGGSHAVALKTDGSLWAWGFNLYGQLGDGTNKDKNMPIQIGTDTNWAMLAAGGNHTIALKTDGTLWTWGSNWRGQLGDGSNKDKNTPTQIGSDTNWAILAAGGNHTIALKTDGTIWAWGMNSGGELGDGTNGNKNIPTQIGTDADWTAIAAGLDHTIALKTNGSLWAWGFNNHGQIGDGTNEYKNTPTQIGTDTSWERVAAGNSFTLALKTDNTLWTWGSNDRGQLGIGTNEDKNMPVQIIDYNWSAAVAGNNYTVALKTNSTLWAWGDNYSGWMEDGTNENKTVPTQIGIDSDWRALAAGFNHTVALKRNGTLWTWRLNDHGQLGDGTYDDKITPTQIGTDTNWEVIAAGRSHTIALKTDGTLWAWGENTYGQLGDGTNEDKNTPTQIGTDTDWEAVAAGYRFTLALKTDGTLWTWGSNDHGQLGDGTNKDKNIPTHIETDTDWAVVGAGGDFSIALKIDGTLWSWGTKLFDPGILEDINAPTQIGTGNEWSMVAPGSSGWSGFTMALKIGGSLWALR